MCSSEGFIFGTIPANPAVEGASLFIILRKIADESKKRALTRFSFIRLFMGRGHSFSVISTKFRRMLLSILVDGNLQAAATPKISGIPHIFTRDQSV